MVLLDGIDIYGCEECDKFYVLGILLNRLLACGDRAMRVSLPRSRRRFFDGIESLSKHTLF